MLSPCTLLTLQYAHMHARIAGTDILVHTWTSLLPCCCHDSVTRCASARLASKAWQEQRVCPVDTWCPLTTARLHADLKLYTRRVEVTRDKIPSWPHDKLTVLAEQSSIFYDLMIPELVEQVIILLHLHPQGKLGRVSPPVILTAAPSCCFYRMQLTLQLSSEVLMCVWGFEA